jgi:hypothetical protein
MAAHEGEKYDDPDYSRPGRGASGFGFRHVVDG